MGEPMALIKVRDLAWVRLRAPDLDAMEEFLTHFGLTRAARVRPKWVRNSSIASRSGARSRT